ncbi:MAG: FG-GAP-like repeat-containing protein [Candidatus Eisenbacteria bacterium]
MTATIDLWHRIARRSGRCRRLTGAMLLIATSGPAAAQSVTTPITIPLDPVQVVTEEADPDQPHGFIERPEGAYLYEIATGRLLALPPIDAHAILTGFSGQSLDQAAVDPVLPAILRPLDAWPQSLPEIPAGPPAIGDVTGDGKPEIVLTMTDGEVLVFDARGAVLPGWPRLLEAPIHHGATLADVNGDGKTEILVATESGNAHVLLSSGGEELAGWPVCLESLGRGEKLRAPPVVADLDGNGDLEIILTGTEGTFEAYSSSGGQLPGWPIHYRSGTSPTNPASCLAAPCVADLEGDGELEIVAALNSGVVVATDADGVSALGWPRILPSRARGGFGPVAVTDLDRRGGLDVVVATDRGFPGPPQLVAYRHNGTVLSGWPVELPYPANGGVAVADLDGDGSSEVLVATVGGDGEVLALRADGSALPGWPRRFPAVSFGPGVVVGDVDGRPGPEVVLLGTTATYDSRAELYVLNAKGQPLDGFPVEFETADAFGGGVTLGDIDQDGRQELLIALGGSPRIAIYQTAGTAGEKTTPWPRSSRGPERIARAPRVERSSGPQLPPDRDPGPDQPLPRNELPASLDPNTTISFVLNRPADIRLRILDIQGLPVRTALAGPLPKGLYAIEWDGRDESGETMPTGVYFFELEVDGAVRTKRLVSLLR